MKITTIAAVFLSLLFVNLVAADTSFVGTYQLDANTWKAQVAGALATHSVKTTLSDQQTMGLVNLISQYFGTISVKEDGTFSMSNEFVTISGSWVEKDGMLVATEKEYKFITSLPGMVELADFHLFVKDGTFHYGQEKDGPSDLPLIRLQEATTK
jgi:hypothetical protein